MLHRLTSTAVMQRRHEPDDSLDFFPTPPWGTRTFAKFVLPQVIRPEDLARKRTAWDPACGEGHMALALADDFDLVYASDIFDYGFGDRIADFLHPDFNWLPADGRPADWIVINPPFNQAADFVTKALSLCGVGVAVLARSAFAEGQERYHKLFSPRARPPVLEAVFVERLPMFKGRWVVKGKSATAYSWFVWLKHPTHDQIRAGTRKFWIPPCRTLLSKPHDWLNFRGCSDLPKTHAAVKIAEQMAARKQEAAARPKPPTIGDIRRALELELGDVR